MHRHSHPHRRSLEVQTLYALPRHGLCDNGITIAPGGKADNGMLPDVENCCTTRFGWLSTSQR